MLALGTAPDQPPRHTLPHHASPPRPAHTHRNLFTPRLKSRSRQRSSLLEHSAPAGPLQPSGLSSDFPVSPPRPARDMQHFEKVELEDFLVEAIVGQRSFPDKSADIIRSLNGTWFKDTSHPEPVSSRFFSSLGVKHRKLAAQMGHRISKTASLQQVETQFHAHYTPPNLFPSRRTPSPSKRPSGPRRPSVPHPVAAARPELVAQVLRRVGASSARRAFRSGGRSGGQGQSSRSLAEAEEVLVGTKMVLHGQ